MNSTQFKNAALLALVIILSIVAVISNLPSVPKRSTGSFEYIRKGEDLLDGGKYSQAIKYFEKAYESSPDNETISSDLVYAYSMYSRILANENKYDAAIEYLEKAYNVAQNSSAAQNLAIGYSEKALYEAKRAFVRDAKDDYNKARQYASMSSAISRNLGIIMYNDGISEFKSGREDIALLCFKESSFVYKDARTFELLGDIYYKKADLRMARFYWRLGLSLNPANETLAKKMTKVRKEMALAAKEKESNIQHFEIRYTTDLPIDKEFAAKVLESAYTDIGKDLGYFPDVRTKVFFYSKKDFRNTFNMPYFVKAFYDGSIKMPAPETYLDKDMLSRYIYHEYAHALVSAKTNNNCPAWLSEGIAVWEEFNKERLDMRTISRQILKTPDISFKFLDESFRTDEISENKALCYVLSYTLVDFILDAWGLPGLKGVLKRLANKQHIVNAIDDEFLMSESQFEQKWRDYANRKFFAK